eukprot:TRINITY_DN8034_c0_g1_i1.p3 TRINITY_DN8034_c0_g1~~TRINITY_DN8034_c0_g1_i1.p3  ORF type:complete len:144 (+),score=71.74 TRINITY_DN8034_c0_g1_i1:62-433(+)
MASTAPPNLVATMRFNPPTITLVGGLKERTLEQLNELLPSMCTTSKEGRHDPPRFQEKVQKDSGILYYHVELRGQYCDNLGVCFLFTTLFDCLEEEGRWMLQDTNAVTMPEGECYKFFFVKKS